MNFFSDVPLIPGASEFRLMDRQVVQELSRIRERSRFLRALVQWLGFRVTTVEFQANERVAGVTSFSYIRLLRLALDGVISFSTMPLRIIAYVGFFTAFACLPYAIWAIYQFLLYGQRGVPGWSSLIVAVIFIGGVQLISLGVIGEYIGRIYTEVKDRPLYVVQERFGFGTEEQNDSLDT
ncbi:MAG: hypothetical protein Q4C96_08225 [Planctomycetia bacterium]|nr:hypothetical protein [Planctomycetia bacterium]